MPHSFVSLLSDDGIPLEEISRLVGHSSTAVTEAVYRKQPGIASQAVREVLEKARTEQRFGQVHAFPA